MDNEFSGKITNQKKENDAESLGTIITSIKPKKSMTVRHSIGEIKNIITCIKIAEKWPKCAGRQIRLKTAIKRLVGGKLFIDTYNSAWAANLTMMKNGILDKLNSEIAPYKVSDIIFRPAYPLRQPKVQEEKKIQEVVLSDDELKEAFEVAKDIEDDNIRESYKKFIIRDLIRRKEKVQSGGSICPVCRCAHEKKGLCLYCKLNYDPENQNQEGIEMPDYEYAGKTYI